MNVNSLKEYLENNHEEIIKILEQCDFYHISFNSFKNEIRCATHKDGNKTAVKINCNNLSCISFNKDISGDVIQLIMEHNDLNYIETLNKIQDILNLNFNNKNNHKPLFGGIYKQIERICQDDDNEEVLYDINILNEYINIPNVRFLNDNITISTQKKFKILFDPITNRIIVPWFNLNGNLVGVTGRYNFNDCGDIPKWLSVHKFQKSNYLYGLYENYDSIKKEGYVIIGESEKFVMQLASYGYHIGVALGGCIITDRQVGLIKSLPINKVILAFDENLSIKHIIKQAEKLKNGLFNKKEIYIIYDKNNKILKKGSKNAPTDSSMQNFEYLLKNCCYRKE